VYGSLCNSPVLALLSFSATSVPSIAAELSTVPSGPRIEPPNYVVKFRFVALAKFHSTAEA
jgi:hypothetical protein